MLSTHLQRKSRELHADLTSRVIFQAEQVDLTSLRSVKALSSKLLTSRPKLDVILLNAGYGGLAGIDWLGATWAILTDFPYAVTYPTYNISGKGLTTEPQTTSRDEPPLGTVFTSNVFGHYLLVHQLASLFPKASNPQRRGRIIWISSVEGYASTFSPNDIQGLAAESAYQSSKRLTDVLALTSSLPSTRQHVSDLLTNNDSSKPEEESRNGAKGPEMYLAHPGICATSFVPLPLILYYLMTLTFYIARWVGSPWHTVSSYKGAAAPVWLTLASQEELDDLEAKGKSKWGSCVTRGGRESEIRTEVEGWGARGKVEKLDKGTLNGRRKGVKDLTQEEREGFEELGRECWQQMEALRVDWEKRLGW